MVTIIQDRCVGCGSCTQVCFYQNLKIQKGKAVAGASCMDCGQCYAVCPAQAISLPDYPEDSARELSPWDPKLEPDTLLQALQARRSIRDYQDKPVPRSVLRQLLEAGRFTPTGVNAQDVTYVVVQEQLPQLRDALWEGFQTGFSQHMQAGLVSPLYQKLYDQLVQDRASGTQDGLLFNAPVLLLLSSRSPLSAPLAASSITLMAHVMGLGSLYSGFLHTAITHSPQVCQTLGLSPDQLRVCMLLGYPRRKYRRTAPRKPVTVVWK